jgi:peptidoglycan/xylan/chitin deacetylase (PgdA/CDA1 family)
LDILDGAGVKATFFVNGQNYGNIYDYASVLQRMDGSGHQIGSHTWSHADLATLDAGGITSEMTQVEDALISIIGKFPTYMRPPYFSTNGNALSTLGGLGYHVIQADIDTKDYEHQDSTIGVAASNFQDGINSGGSISLEHDPLDITVHQLVGQLIGIVQAAGKTRKHGLNHFVALY